MAGSLTPIPWWTILDANGDPVSGARVYVYAAGTVTPFVVYQDSTMLVPHAQPAVADAAGRITIYLPIGASVKYTVKTSADVLIREQDNVSSVDVSSDIATTLAALQQATIAWPGSDETALVGVSAPAGATNAARAPGTALMVLTATFTVTFEATLWVEAGGTATVGLYSTATPNTPIVSLTSTNADGARVISGSQVLAAGTYIIKGHSGHATALAYAVGYRIVPVL